MQLRIGNGNFTVSATINALIFKELDATYTIGQDIDIKNSSDKILDSYTLYFQTYQEVQQLKQLLKDSYEHRVFSFKYLDFDLTNYSRKSVDCIIDQLNWIEKFLPRTQVI